MTTESLAPARRPPIRISNAEVELVGSARGELFNSAFRLEDWLNSATGRQAGPDQEACIMGICRMLYSQRKPMFDTFALIELAGYDDEAMGRLLGQVVDAIEAQGKYHYPNADWN